VKAVAVALNTPLVDPDEIVSEDGTVKLVELELRTIVPPPDPSSVTVQAVEVSGPIVAGLQAIAAIPELVGTATSESVVDLEEPSSVPVRVII
jgi:hypothetical protein